RRLSAAPAAAQVRPPVPAAYDLLRPADASRRFKHGSGIAPCVTRTGSGQHLPAQRHAARLRVDDMHRDARRLGSLPRGFHRAAELAAQGYDHYFGCVALYCRLDQPGEVGGKRLRACRSRATGGEPGIELRGVDVDAVPILRFFPDQDLGCEGDAVLPHEPFGDVTGAVGDEGDGWGGHARPLTHVTSEAVTTFVRGIVAGNSHAINAGQG